jgi:hypothetical protein
MRAWIPLIAVAALATVTACAGADRGASDEAAAAARAAELEAQAAARQARVAALEAERLAELWTYHDVPLPGGRQLTASIRSTNDLDTDGSGARSVQLVFREHPSWGRSSYLVLQTGDFDCAHRCRVAVTVDDRAPQRMDARRPDTEEAIAMFIDDARSLWRATAGATQLQIEFPVRVGGTRIARFAVGGLNRSRMPGWDAASGG